MCGFVFSFAKAFSLAYRDTWDTTLHTLSHMRRYMLQLLERPAYQRAFGAGTAEQLMTIVTLGEMMRRFERISFLFSRTKDVEHEALYMIVGTAWLDSFGAVWSAKTASLEKDCILLSTIPFFYNLNQPSIAVSITTSDCKRRLWFCKYLRNKKGDSKMFGLFWVLPDSFDA